jgi:hypothetical protein
METVTLTIRVDKVDKSHLITIGDAAAFREHRGDSFERHSNLLRDPLVDDER